VGAVTHVLVNDPTKGYGIFIEKIWEAAERVTGPNTRMTGTIAPVIFCVF